MITEDGRDTIKNPMPDCSFAWTRNNNEDYITWMILIPVVVLFIILIFAAPYTKDFENKVHEQVVAENGEEQYCINKYKDKEMVEISGRCIKYFTK